MSNRDVFIKFQSYPLKVRGKLLFLRRLIFDVASTLDGESQLEETLKWNEPSYLLKGGSAVRIDWKAKSPNQFFIYFNCKTRLVETFREYYGDQLDFDGNRAIVFTNGNDASIESIHEELRHCIALALRYHSIKHLPMLGVS
ncbi:MAG: DUF1801 domain-containing protein [Gammaproteobacteria bacterium]|nr:DUF1801 domain-containing protein [Gammaproteobacteria bacterium]